MEDLQKTKADLSARLKMNVSEGKICINQKHYIDNLVRRFGLSDVCGVSTPADACVKLVADDGVSRPADPKLYQQIVESLQYAAGGTRPDIAYVVSEILSPTYGAVHDSCQTCTEVSEANERPQLDICQGIARSHHWLLRSRLGRRCAASTFDLRKCVLNWRRCHHVAGSRFRWLCRPSKQNTWL